MGIFLRNNTIILVPTNQKAFVLIQNFIRRCFFTYSEKIKRKEFLKKPKNKKCRQNITPRSWTALRKKSWGKIFIKHMEIRPKNNPILCYPPPKCDKVNCYLAAWTTLHIFIHSDKKNGKFNFITRMDHAHLLTSKSRAIISWKKAFHLYLWREKLWDVEWKEGCCIYPVSKAKVGIFPCTSETITLDDVYLKQ